jgi:LacI family transcriptional regulator
MTHPKRKKPSGPATMADIALALGISKMTVSRAINNRPGITEQTRAEVLKVAREMNYRLNPHARALITNRSYLIGVVVPDLMHSYFAELAKAIQTAMRPAGYEILICNTNEDAATELAEVEALRHRTDGLIIASAIASAKIAKYRKMIREGVKIVLIDRRLENLRCPMVLTDNVRVGRIATEHLISLGHRRIGHLSGEDVQLAQDRLEGYRQALSARGLPVREELIRKCGFVEEEGYRAMRQWIADGSLPTAIFSVNDPVAIGALQALEEARLRVPQDLALMGAGEIHYGDRLSVPLSTVTWDKSVLGQQAAEKMLALLEEKDVPGARVEPVVIEPRLVIRKSSGGKRA